MTRWLGDRSTKTKLMLGFGILVVVLVGVGAVGYWSARGLGGYVTESYENGLVPVSDVTALQKEIYELRLAMLGFWRTIGTPAMAKFEEAALKREAEISRMGEKVAASVKTVEERTLAESWRKAWAHCIAAHREVLRLGNAGDRNRALEVVTGTGLHGMQYGDHFAGVLGDAAKLAALKLGHAQQIADDSRRVTATAAQLILAAVAAALVMAVLLAVLLARAIAGPLARSVEVIEAVADGDFTKRIEVQRLDEIGRMAEALNRAVESIQTVLLKVTRAASAVATASQQLSATAGQISSGAQEQASSLEQTAASLEQITGTVKQNADNSRQANQLAAGSRETAEKGGQVVTTAVTAMAELNKSSKKIADIITTIDEIAFQTNLLALNAAVEAARAGEQGRGFAVVAAEVRNLAQRSATAAKEIKALIEDSVTKVAAGSELVNKSGETLEEIVTSVKRVTDIIAEITAASQEQSSGIDQVNKAVSQMDQVTQSNAAQTEELSSTAQSLAGQAEQLQQLVGRFKLEERRAGRAAVEAPRAARAATRPAPKPATATPRPKRAEPVPALAHAANGSAGAKDDGFEDF